MTIANLVTATNAGKIKWRPHDNGVGWWAVVATTFRLDLVSGSLTLRRDGFLIETLTDTEGALESAITTFISDKKAAILAEFATQLAEA